MPSNRSPAPASSTGDYSLSLVTGETIIEADHLADGIHPGDEGHKRIAAAMAKALNTAIDSDGTGALRMCCATA